MAQSVEPQIADLANGWLKHYKLKYNIEQDAPSEDIKTALQEYEPKQGGSGGNISTLKCDKCQDGYLIVKEGKVEPFLGCTNFKADKTGCGGFMTREYYVNFIRNQSL